MPDKEIVRAYDGAGRVVFSVTADRLAEALKIAEARALAYFADPSARPGFPRAPQLWLEYLDGECRVDLAITITAAGVVRR